MIISAEEYLKQQGQTSTPTPTGSSGIISAENYLKSQPAISPTPTQQPQVQVPQVNRPSPFKQASIIPEDFGNVPFLSGLMENLVAPAIRPVEQFARLPLAATSELFGFHELTPKILPGIEEASPLETAKESAKRTLRALADAIALKGGVGMGGKLTNLATRGATGFGGFQAAQPEATPANVALSSLLGGIAVPTLGIGGSYAPIIARQLAGKAQLPSEVKVPLTQALSRLNLPLLPEEKLLPAAGKTTKPSIITPPPVEFAEEKIPGGLPKRLAVEKPFEVPATFEELPPQIKIVSEELAPNVPDITPKIKIPEIPPEKIKPSELQVIGRGFFHPIQIAIEKMGGAGKELSNSINRFRQNEFTFRGKMQVNINDTFPSLNPKEQLNFFESVEGKSIPINNKVTQAVEANKQFANTFYNENVKRNILQNMVDDTGKPVINPDTYVPHMLNEKGWHEYTFNEDKFFKSLAKFNKADEATIRDTWMRYIQRNLTPKAFFEKERAYNIPPEWLEHDPIKLWNRYNSVAAKRYGLLDEFGRPIESADEMGEVKLDYPKLKELLNLIYQSTGKESANYAREATDLMIGRSPVDFEARNIAARLQEFQLISKITPLTTLPNMQQGLLASINQHGFRYALQGLRDMFTKEGDRFAHQTGLIGTGFYTPPNYGLVSKIWKSVTGFPLTEDWNFRLITNSAKHFLKDSFVKLRKNPTDTALRKQFELHGLSADELLAKGQLTDDDLLKGAFIVGRDTIFPRLIEQAPKWTQNPWLKLAYQFSHFGLKQPEMLSRQFKVSKTRGTTSLLKFLATQAVLGEPVADIWSLIRNKERPESLPVRLGQNVLYSGVLGVPAELFRTLLEGYSGVFGPLAGPTASGFGTAATRILQDIKKGEAGKVLEDLIRARVRGDIPIGGPPIPAGSFFERLVPRKPLPRE